MAAKLPDAMVAAGKALDVAAATQLIGLKPRAFYLNDAGQKATPQDYVLAGLHTMRAANPTYFNADEVAASNAWLSQNGWKVPA